MPQDMVASIFVLWRFWNVVDSEASLRANEDRELRANVCIAFIVRPQYSLYLGCSNTRAVC